MNSDQPRRNYGRAGGGGCGVAPDRAGGHGHAHGAHGIAKAVAAGFDGIERGAFLTADGVKQDSAVVDQLAAINIKGKSYRMRRHANAFDQGRSGLCSGRAVHFL
jgi:hypothetical protein